MTYLLVEKAGPATSIQDSGRKGTQRYGLAPSGALDIFSMAAANILVGLPANNAAIEIGPLPARFKACDGDIRLALTGALRMATISDQKLGMDQSFMLREGMSLDVPAARGAGFSYLSIEGGIAGEPSFGSLSVHARAGLGSPFSRPFQAGDRLEVQAALRDAGEFRLEIEPLSKGPIRVVQGPQDDYFASAEIEKFFARTWTISPASDRMGYRLSGEAIVPEKGFNIVSDGTVNGHIQIPGNGQPLVLLMDRGTTGGYPKIAAIISADLGRFAQIPVGGEVRFTPVTMEQAQAEAIRFRNSIAALENRLKPVLAGRLSSEALLSINLTGGVVHAMDSRSWSGFIEV